MATDTTQSSVDQATSPASAYLKALKVPAVFLLVGVCLIAAYYSIYVSNSLEYLKGRDLRFLLTLESEIQAALAGHQTVLSSFANDYDLRGRSDLIRCIPENPAARSIPMFAYITLDTARGAKQTKPDCSEASLGPVDTQRQPTVVAQARFVDDAGTVWTRRFGGAARADAKVVPFRIDLSQLLEPVFNHQLEEDAFDQLLLVTPSGRVIFSRGSSEVRLTSLDSMVRRDPEGKWKKQPFAGLGHVSQVLDVRVSDEDYVLYLQPCCIRMRDSSNPKTEPGWVVAGLTKRSTLRNDSMAVSFSIMALTAGLILLAVFSWPFLKLTLLGRDRRLRLIDVLAVGICSLLGIALVVLFVADWYSYGRLKNDLDHQLQDLSSDIQHNARAEIDSAYRQLRILDRWTASAKPEERTTKLFAQPGLEGLENAAYPFLETFSLIDSTGWQRNKWASAEYTTPFVRTRSREYFKHWQNHVPRKQPLDRVQPADDASTNAYLESIRSATTGSKEAVLSAPTDSITLDRTSKKITVAAMAIPMRSLNDVALPPGFKFAVIDSTGHVLFHSDQQRSLVEQFFLETDRSRRLRAAIAARHAEALSVRYLGQDFRAYVAPLERINGSGWSLVTLFDRQLLRTVNIEWVITTMLFTVIYASLYIALCIVVLISRPAYRAPWVWPDSGKQKEHQRLIAAYGVFGIAFIVAMFGVEGRQLLAFAWTLPFVVWITTYLTVTGREGATRPRWRMMACLLGLILVMLLLVSGEGWLGITVWGIATAGVLLPLVPVQLPVRQPYIVAATMLLVLTGALPTLAAFVVARAIQVDSYIKYGQLSLARQVQPRLILARPAAELADHRRTELEHRRRVLDRSWGRYGHFFYHSTVVDTSEPNAIASTCGARPDAQEQDPRHELPTLLEDLLPFYSESSVGMRELLHDRSSDGVWHWHRTDTTLVLHSAQTAGWDIACVRSALPTFATSLASIDDAGTVAEVVVLIALAIFAMVWIARFAARRIFLIDVIEPLWARRVAPFPVHPGEHLYIVWQAADRNARDLVEDGMYVVDIEKVRGSGDKGFAAERDRLERLPTGQTIVVDHLEARNGSPTFDDSKFEFVRDALDVQHRTVVLVSGVRPRSLVARIAAARASESATIERRWTALLKRFTVLDGVPNTDTLERSVFKEVGLGREREDGSRTPLRREQILEEVGDRLDNYNRGIWESCSDAQKLVLLHLANEGLVNEKNRRTVRLLLARGLIRKNPNFGFVNETFRRFLLSRIPAAEVAEMEEKSISAWDAVRLPFLITLMAVSAFFFLTQRELFTTTVAVITALAGGIPSLVRVVGMFERKPDTTRAA